MEVVNFEGANGAIKSENGKELPVSFDKNTGIVVTCWELSMADLIKIHENKKIYLCTQVGKDAPLQPTLLTATNPVTKK